MDKRNEKPPSEDPFAFFWKALSGHHKYKVISKPICQKGDKDCNVFNVYATTLESNQNIAPTTSTDPVTDGSTVPISYSGGGTIKTTIDRENLSVTNETLPGHPLYPGTVTRMTRELPSGDIVEVTEGTGEGIFPRFNEFAAPVVWSLPDSQLRQAWKTKPAKGKEGDSSKFKFDPSKEDDL